MTPRPALTEEQIKSTAHQHVSFFCDVEQGALEPETAAWAEGIFIAGARFALAALASQEQRRLARYDEAIRLLRMSEHARPGSLYFRAYEIKRDEFLAAEPAEKGNSKISFDEITPEEAQKRYLRSLKGSGE